MAPIDSNFHSIITKYRPDYSQCVSSCFWCCWWLSGIEKCFDSERWCGRCSGSQNRAGKWKGLRMDLAVLLSTWTSPWNSPRSGRCCWTSRFRGEGASDVDSSSRVENLWRRCFWRWLWELGSSLNQEHNKADGTLAKTACKKLGVAAAMLSFECSLPILVRRQVCRVEWASFCLWNSLFVFFGRHTQGIIEEWEHVPSKLWRLESFLRLSSNSCRH